MGSRNYAELIQQELDALDHLNSRRSMRDKTLLAVAAAVVDGRSINSVLGTGGAVRESTYYSKKKDWHNNRDFKRALNNIIALYRQRDTEMREAAEAEAREKRHRERARLIDEGKAILTSLIAEQLHQAELIKLRAQDALDNGEVPQSVGLEARLDELTRFMKVIFSEERTEFDETPASKIQAEFDWRANLPDGVTPSDADEALNQFAEIIVRQQLQNVLDGRLGADDESFADADGAD
jgi:hypothetical protein